MEKIDLENLRAEAQALAGAGISALLPKLIEDAIQTDDPELRVKIFTSLRPLSGMDAPKAPVEQQAGSSLQIKFILQGVEPIDVAARASSLLCVDADTTVNKDVESGQDADPAV